MREKEKGAASDSFKRACFNRGIGRELYSAPFIWLPADRVCIRHDGKRYVTPERFMVGSISYDGNREICGLEIRNSANHVVFARRMLEPSQPGGPDPVQERLPGLREGVEEARQRQPERSLLQR